MMTFNMQPLPGKNTIKPVLYVDVSAGHAAVAEETEHRFFILHSIVSVLSCSKVNALKENELADLCLSLETLIDEAHGLHTAAYHLALEAGKQEDKPDDASRK